VACIVGVPDGKKGLHVLDCLDCLDCLYCQCPRWQGLHVLYWATCSVLSASPMTRPTCSAGTAPVMHALTTSHVHAAPWPDANTVLAILGKGSLCPLTHGQALCTPHAWSSPLPPHAWSSPLPPHAWSSPLHPSCMDKPSAPLTHGQPLCPLTNGQALCPLMHGQALCTPHAWSSPLHPSRMVNPSAPLMHGQPHAGL